MRSKALKGKAGARRSDVSADPVSEFYTRPLLATLRGSRDSLNAEALVDALPLLFEKLWW